MNATTLQLGPLTLPWSLLALLLGVWLGTWWHERWALRRQLAKEMKKAAATARGNAQVRQSTLEDNEAGRFSPKRETADQTLPTRWPTSKRMTPSVNDPMLADLVTECEALSTVLRERVAALRARVWW